MVIDPFLWEDSQPFLKVRKIVTFLKDVKGLLANVLRKQFHLSVG